MFLLKGNSDKAKPGHLRLVFLVPFENVALPTELSHYPDRDNKYSYF